MREPSPFGDGPAGEAFSRDGTSIALFEVRPERPGDRGAARRRRPALLLVHGATADHTTWRTVGPALAATRPVFAMDRRGRGESGDRQPYSIEREFEDVAAAADEIARRQRGPVDIAGHSYGGRCALGASLLSPAIRRLVVYEGAPAPPGVSYRTPGLTEAVRDALDRGDDEGALMTFLGGIVGMSEAELAAYRANPVWPARVAAASTILREVEAEASPAASTEALGRVAVPVLLLLGSTSRSPFRIGTDALATALAQPEVVVIDGAAHAAHHSHPDEFVGVVQEFLDR
jgi:pimeloyl-ACP methyl ester carboxylesterase